MKLQGYLCRPFLSINLELSLIAFISVSSGNIIIHIRRRIQMLQTMTTLVSPPTRVVSRIFTGTGQCQILSRLCYLKYFLTNVDQPRLRPDWILIILGLKYFCKFEIILNFAYTDLFSLDGSQQSLSENIHGVGDAHPPSSEFCHSSGSGADDINHLLIPKVFHRWKVHTILVFATIQ